MQDVNKQHAVEQMSGLQARMLALSSVILVAGLSLWLMEEAHLLAPTVFPKDALPFGGDDSRQPIFSFIAISAFPLGGLTIHPSDKFAVRSLLKTWALCCLMLGMIFTATSVIIFTHQETAPGAKQDLRYRILIHILNAVIGFSFAHRFYGDLQIASHSEALQRAWKAGHTAGTLIAIAWPLACLERFPLALVSPDSIGASWDPLLFFLPSAALLCYVALTCSPLRARLLRWMRAGRSSLVAAVGTRADETSVEARQRSDGDAVSTALAQSFPTVGGMTSLWCGFVLLAPPLCAASLALMSSRKLDHLRKIAAEGGDVREALQLAHLMLGVAHAIMMRGHRAQAWLGAWAIGITLFGDGAALAVRLGDASLVWMLVRDACLPALIGWLLAKLSARVSARYRTQQLEELRAELGKASVLLGDEKRRSAELEEARRSALVSSALARHSARHSRPEAGTRVSSDLTGKAPDDAASDGTNLDAQSSASSQVGVPPSLPPGPPSPDDTASSPSDEVEGQWPAQGLVCLKSTPLDDTCKPISPRPWQTTSRDGACCARGMRQRGVQVLMDASTYFRRRQERGALFDSLPPHQKDRLLMPPPPARPPKAKATAAPDTLPTKRPRQIGLPGSDHVDLLLLLLLLVLLVLVSSLRPRVSRSGLGDGGACRRLC